MLHRLILLNSQHGAASHTLSLATSLWMKTLSMFDACMEGIDKRHPNYTLLHRVTKCIQLKLISPSMADNQSSAHVHQRSEEEVDSIFLCCTTNWSHSRYTHIHFNCRKFNLRHEIFDVGSLFAFKSELKIGCINFVMERKAMTTKLMFEHTM